MTEKGVRNCRHVSPVKYIFNKLTLKGGIERSHIRVRHKFSFKMVEI